MSRTSRFPTRALTRRWFSTGPKSRTKTANRFMETPSVAKLFCYRVYRGRINVLLSQRSCFAILFGHLLYVSQGVRSSSLAFSPSTRAGAGSAARGRRCEEISPQYAFFSSSTCCRYGCTQWSLQFSGYRSSSLPGCPTRADRSNSFTSSRQACLLRPAGNIFICLLAIQVCSAILFGGCSRFFFLQSISFSMKLLWAPVVDSVYWRRIGRRKSWMVPCQYLIGLFMLLLSFRVPYIMGEGTGGVFGSFFVLKQCNLMCFIAHDHFSR